MTPVSLIAAASVLIACCTAPVASLAQTPPSPAASTATNREGVAFSRLTVTDADHPDIEAGVWWPAEAATTPRPMVVVSHGNGGDFRSHHDTAKALAQAGFVVATLTHTGDNWRDQSRATDVVGRTRQLSVLIDHMLTRWEDRASIDAGRIGAFGFSAGGFTVLAAAGGNPDLTRLVDHCRVNPGFYDCTLIGQHSEMTKMGVEGRLQFTHDTRIKALAVAAPALGFTFVREGLAAVTQPVQLWQAEADQILPAPFYAEPVRDNLPTPPEYHRIDRAGHFDFLPPCSPELVAAAPMICAPTPGFDRAAFHDRLNAEVVRFFEAEL